MPGSRPAGRPQRAVPRGLLACALFTLGFVATSTQRAEACSGIYAFDVPGAYATVPANGGALVTLHCRIGTSSCEWPDPIHVWKGEEEVAGRFVHHGEDYVFIPDAPLEVGAVYTVPGFGEVTAIAAVPVDLASILVTPTIIQGSVLGAHDEVCCDEPKDTCGGYSCWRTSEVTETTTATLVVTKDSKAFEAVRAELRFTWSNSEDFRGGSAWSTGYTAEASLQAFGWGNSYCTVPELRSMITGETLVLDEICVSASDVPTPGQATTLPPEILEADLGVCPVPVAGYLEEWCEDRKTECAATGLNGSCESVAEHCSGGSLGDDVTWSGDYVNPPRSDDAETDMSDAAVNDDRVTGCSTQTPGGVAGTWSLLGALTLSGLALRRRSSRSPLPGASTRPH